MHDWLLGARQYLYPKRSTLRCRRYGRRFSQSLDRRANALEQLSSDDLTYILDICGSGYRPAEFGNSDALRLASWRYFKDLGFSATEAAVAVGMTFNFVGRDDV